MRRNWMLCLCSWLLVACGTGQLTEDQRMLEQIRKDVGFRLDSLQRIDECSWSFASDAVITAPDYELKPDGSLWVYRAILAEPFCAQHEEVVWRNFYKMPDSVMAEALSAEYGRRIGIYHYDLALKNRLEQIFERDQYGRMQWTLSRGSQRDETPREALLRLRAARIDSLNQLKVSRILSQQGFPSKDRVGGFAREAVWIVVQHAGLGMQKACLPILEQAAAAGNLEPAAVAALHDRIDVREGLPQKYGTQRGGDGKLCRLLDKKMVNQWRQEVGLPPI